MMSFEFLPIYTICFMNYLPKADEVSKFRTDIVLADKDNGKQASNKLRFVYLALPLFKKKAEDCDSDFDKWIYVLTHMEALTRMPWTAQKKIFEKLEEYADSHRLSKKEWEAYENSLWIARDNMACMAAAEREAREKGMAEGVAKGMAEGRAEGRAEGKNLANLATAKRMLEDGMTIEQIIRYTGLSREQLEA